jgi:hypothetical protein
VDEEDAEESQLEREWRGLPPRTGATDPSAWPCTRRKSSSQRAGPSSPAPVLPIRRRGLAHGGSRARSSRNAGKWRLRELFQDRQRRLRANRGVRRPGLGRARRRRWARDAEGSTRLLEGEVPRPQRGSCGQRRRTTATDGEGPPGTRRDGWGRPGGRSAEDGSWFQTARTRLEKNSNDRGGFIKR